jgi:hypothetical protein
MYVSINKPLKFSKFRRPCIWTLLGKALKDFLIGNVSAGNETSASYGLGGPGLSGALRPRHNSGDCSLAPNRGGLGSIPGLHTYLLTYLLTYSFEQRHSLVVNRFSASQEIPRIL